MFIKTKKAEGITLIELLVVIGVVSILVSGLIILINPFQKLGQANDAKRKSDLAQLQRGLEIYYQDNDEYPISAADYTISGTFWGGTWDPYLPRLPKDPSANQTYIYYAPNAGACLNHQCYYLYASLQAGGKDPQACYKGTGNDCANAVAFGLNGKCGGKCNYGVTSANTTP